MILKDNLDFLLESITALDGLLVGGRGGLLSIQF